MKKFDLAEARRAEAATAPLASGFYGAVVVQVAEVGLQPGFRPADPPRDMIGVTFELEGGRTLAKTGAAQPNPRGMLGQVLTAVDVDAADLAVLLGAWTG